MNYDYLYTLHPDALTVCIFLCVCVCVGVDITASWHSRHASDRYLLLLYVSSYCYYLCVLITSHTQRALQFLHTTSIDMSSCYYYTRVLTYSLSYYSSIKASSHTQTRSSERRLKHRPRICTRNSPLITTYVRIQLLCMRPHTRHVPQRRSQI